MKVIFFGTPAFAVPTLRRLLESDHSVELVVTRPDRPRGRRLRTEAPPIKVLAERSGLPVIQPERLTPDLRSCFESVGADAGVVVAYGQLLPAWLLELPPLGFVNVHPSLVPRHRGAAPMERAIFEGDVETGVSILKMGTGLDDGPVYSQERFPLSIEDDAGSLHDRCSEIGARLIVETLGRIERGEASPVPQPDEGVTYAEKLRPDERWIVWSEPAERTINRVRALSPRPGATTTVRGKELKVFRTVPVSGVLSCRDKGEGKPSPAHPVPPGSVLAVEAEGPVIATGTTPVILTELQLEGRARMSAPDFLRGFRLEAGDILEGSGG